MFVNRKVTARGYFCLGVSSLLVLTQPLVSHPLGVNPDNINDSPERLSRHHPLTRPFGYSTRLIAQSQYLPALKPTQPAALEQLNQGLALIQQSKVLEAIVAFEKAAQLNPKLAPL
ncbi:MAG: Tfp pilus assembly protein PilF, partial [Moorea sp. SIO3C2]|nr:Tfp pilus assembly protein PilF [Moorena sp. SIO3C2]